MKKHLYLMPVLALSMGAFALAGCDDKKENQAAAPAAEEVVAESSMPSAEEAIAASIEASDAIAYATAAGNTNGAIFVTLQNPQEAADTLVSATADVAETVELHQNTIAEDGTASMTAVSSIEIPAGQHVRLEPTGYHLMLINLSSPLTEGQTFNAVLNFSNAGAVTVPVRVVTAGDAAAADAAHEGHEGHDHGSEAVEAPVADDVAPSTEEAAPAVEAPAEEAPVAEETPAEAPAETPADETTAQ
jgi:copper(I)-binding protein